MWVNADKEKFPGCCWEASRLPGPMCNEETFLTGAPNDLVMMLGAYGQLVLAVPSVNAAIVSFGHDMRPLEPVRQGVWPAFCTVLGLPCSKPEKVLPPICGESLECLGMAAQCYNGFQPFTHTPPGRPAGAGCVQCLQERGRLWADTHGDEMSGAMQEYCNFGSGDKEKFDNTISFVECFCFLEHDPFVWPKTTTTTPAPSSDPFPPHLYTTTSTTTKHHPNCNIQPSCGMAIQQCSPYSESSLTMESGCVRVAPGDMAPSTGFFWSDDGSLSSVQVLPGQVANTTGKFCPEEPVVESKAPSLRGTVLTSSASVEASSDTIRASLMERATRSDLQTAASAISFETTTYNKPKCYKCMDDNKQQLKFRGCPKSDPGFQSLMWCHCGIPGHGR